MRGFMDARRSGRPDAHDASVLLRTPRQGEDKDATGHRGFFYHFLDMGSARRAWHCELSTIDTALS